MTDRGRNFAPLAQLNQRAFEDPRVQVVNEDAMIWLETAPGGWDAVLDGVFWRRGHNPELRAWFNAQR